MALLCGRLPGQRDLPNGHVNQVLLARVGHAAAGRGAARKFRLLGPHAR